MTKTANDEFYRICSTLAYIFVIFVIGLPMWWKTTEIHRVNLPYDEIAALNETPTTFTMELGIFIRNTEKQRKIVGELETLFASNDIFNVKIVEINIDAMVVANLKTPAQLESMVAKHYETKPGNLLLIEWQKLEEEVLVTSDRTILISETVAAEKIYQVIRTWMVRDYKIRSIFGRVKTFDGKQLRHNTPVPSPAYEVLISVLNPRPDLQTLHWNVQLAAERYIAPFLKELGELSNFTLKSQWKYQIELKYDSKQMKDDTKMGRHFALPDDNLPHIITAIERKLGTDVANKPCIHLVVYVPPCQVAPVYIYRNGQRVANHTFDSFISAQWGGIVIVNPADNICAAQDIEQSPHDIYIHSHEVMDFVLYELRKIFELEVETPITGAGILKLDQITPRLWEKDMYLRVGCIHLVTSATSTLQSLMQLLGDIKNIVIDDHVGVAIEKAYENIVLAKESLLVNDLDEAVKFARTAYIAAELAFADPSLLALLYFPDEQKYAIYIPLYLPIMIPVIMSFTSILKYFRKKPVPELEKCD